MRTYKEAVEKLNGRKSRKIGNNTYLERLDDQTIGVKLHSTYVVQYKADGDVILSSGGWHTLTTKQRLNRYSGATVTQKNYDWFVNGQPFHDGFVLRRIAYV